MRSTGSAAGPLRGRVIGTLGRHAPDQLARLVAGGEEARLCPLAELHGTQWRQQSAAAQIEAVAARQRVEDHAADHDRSVALDLVRIGLEPGWVEDGDRS